MRELKEELLARLVENGRLIATDAGGDPEPVLKLFTPDAGGTWLIAAADPKCPDRVWGLCDAGMGDPELGWTSLQELLGAAGPTGAAVQLDEDFRAIAGILEYARAARRAGMVIA